MVSEGEICAFAFDFIQPYDDYVHIKSLTASRSRIKAYQICNQPPSKVSIVCNLNV